MGTLVGVRGSCFIMVVVVDSFLEACRNLIILGLVFNFGRLFSMEGDACDEVLGSICMFFRLVLDDF
jgi:hypothetical protein